MLKLFENSTHRNVMYSELTSGNMVQANQHIIIDNDQAIVLDPGGHKVYMKLFAMVSGLTPPNGLKYIFFSHQDPDIIAAANGWLMVSDAKAFLSALWLRFIPHFGVDELVSHRINPIPDEGMSIELGASRLKFIPAHFLHSPGNFQVYDPISKILYTGDLGASLGAPYDEVADFDAHIQYMEGFHRRYIASRKAMKMWAAAVRKLDVEIIAPQHGAIFPNRALSARFIDWIEGLDCGLDLMDSYPIPE